MPLVSVVIPIYNYSRFITQAIESVLDQTFRDLEVIVVDDGSTDETAQMVGRFGDRVRYVYQANRGPNAARNTGIREARGSCVAFLDADDYWLPRKLELQVPLIEGSPKVGLVYSGMYLFDSDTGAIIGQHPLGHCRRGPVLRQLFMEQFVPSPTALTRREVFHEVGYFDENVVGPDDWDMWLRIAAIYEFDYVAQPLAMYRVHTSWASSKTFEVYEREMMAFFESASRQYPEHLGELRNRRLNTFQEGLGRRLILQGNARAGRLNLWKAIRWYPFRLRPYVLLLTSYLSAKTPESSRQSRLAYLQGKRSLFNLELRDARRYFLLSIKENPLGIPKAYAGLVLSLGGSRMVRWARAALGADFYTGSPEVGQGISFDQW